jgi:hypothetical protein
MDQYDIRKNAYGGFGNKGFKMVKNVLLSCFSDSLPKTPGEKTIGRDILPFMIKSGIWKSL